MAKEIVIQQQTESPIELHQHTTYVSIEQDDMPMHVEKSNVPRLISALCELSGVSGGVKRYTAEIDETLTEIELHFVEDMNHGRWVKYEDYARLQAEQKELIEGINEWTSLVNQLRDENENLQAEKQVLAESNDNLNEANKQLSMDVHLLQAENERLLKDGRIKTKAENVRLKAENEEMKKEREAAEGAFAEWCGKHFLWIPEDDCWYSHDDMQLSEPKTTAQLLADFRKETGSSVINETSASARIKELEDGIEKMFDIRNDKGIVGGADGISYLIDKLRKKP